MSDTAAAPNNRSVTFRRKPEREMRTHQRLNAEGQTVDGGDSMEKPATAAKSGNPAGLANAAPIKTLSKANRKRAKSAIKRGMISPKAAKKHLGGA